MLQNEVAARLLKSFNFRKQSYIIPTFQVTDWASFTNQPTNDGVEVVSSNTGDTGKCTIWGTTHGTSTVVYETITLNGTTPVATTKTNWGNIYGIFLGDHTGQNITPAIGTITIREASADQTITTILTTKVSKGMVNFLLTGLNITLHNISGNTWQHTTKWATTTNGFAYTAGMVDDLHIEQYLSLIGDTTGSTVQLKVFA